MAETVVNQGQYCDELEGDWPLLPEWVKRRLNFLEDMLERDRKRLAPLQAEMCPRFAEDEDQLSCDAIKNCYPYLCDGRCGRTNEIWLDREVIRELLDREGIRMCPVELSRCARR